jgi:histidine ammonia-lyase
MVMGEETITLNGQNLTIDDVVKVARRNAKVEISPEAYNRLVESRRLVYELASSNIPVYGFNRGVGLNKDRQVDPEFFEEYNRNLILSHCIGVEPEASKENVRAILLARLNTLLLGRTGIQPEIVTMFKELLNHKIHPIIPERGSVGVGDIGCLSHIALAMIGEGEVIYNGKRMNSYEAISKVGLKPIVLGPKDGLGILSSNALAAGEGSLLLKDVEELVDMADLIYSLSLEGLNGNVSPLDKTVNKVRPFPGQLQSVNKIRGYLNDSYLWEKDVTKSIQDPLSFRGAFSVHGSVRDALEHIKKYIHLQLNSSDDNPCVIQEENRIVSCSNFEVTTWVIGVEMLGLALGHLSKMSCYRTIKLSTPSFTGLSRFLSPNEFSCIAFSTIQKTFGALDAEIRHLANPITLDYLSLAGDVEDHASNSATVVQKTAKIVDNLYYILGIEAIHAAQAVELRGDIKLGASTEKAFNIIRSKVPFLDKDRNISVDIKNAYQVLKSGELLISN